MSIQFIKDKVGHSELSVARRQQRQIAYLTQSDVQEEIYLEQLDRICTNGYKGNDHFLNWIGTIFKADNFKTFYKYLRFPIVSAKVVQTKIVPHLERVFFSEDSYYNYTVRGVKVPTPEELQTEKFDEWMFSALLFNYNDVLVHDLKDVNTPERKLISIDNIVSLDSHLSVITEIAYSASIMHPVKGEMVEGYIYINDTAYIFYDKEFQKNLTVEFPHDLGVCPADYVSKAPFGRKEIVRQSIFSYIREELEEYVFLKTIQKMSDPNGAIPIVTKLKSKTKKGDVEESDDKGKGQSVEAMSSSSLASTNVKNEDFMAMQVGTVIEAPMVKKEDGSIDMDLVKNFLNFFRIPVESLDYINRRVTEIEKSLITAAVGDYSEQNHENAKNELQISKSYDSKQDKIRRFANQFTRIRTLSDEKFLLLQHGPDSVEVDLSYGTDFFIESQADLYALFVQSPNPIERATILKRLVQNRGRFNKARLNRDMILYSLLPFTSDKDLDKAIATRTTDHETTQMQLRLTYWIIIFEATYGDLLEFWASLGELKDDQKLIIITNLLKQIIKDYGTIEQQDDGEEASTTGATES